MGSVVDDELATNLSYLSQIRGPALLARETSCGNGSSMLATAIKLIPGLYRAERGELANSLFRDENEGIGGSDLGKWGVCLLWAPCRLI